MRARQRNEQVWFLGSLAINAWRRFCEFLRAAAWCAVVNVAAKEEWRTVGLEVYERDGRTSISLDLNIDKKRKGSG